jgi:hypothetical protein
MKSGQLRFNCSIICDSGLALILNLFRARPHGGTAKDFIGLHFAILRSS